MVVRIASAAALLRSHHSAQRPPRHAAPTMPRGDGKGAGASVSLQSRFDELERLVRELHGGGGGGHARGKGGGGGGFRTATWRNNDHGGGDGGGARDGKGKGRGGRGAGGPSGRPGDWTCQSCHAFPCFSRATACFRCGAQRAGAAKGVSAGKGGARPVGISKPPGRDTYLGPVGAGGSRPLLGGRGGQPGAAAPIATPADPSPTRRVPGASLAARAEAAAALQNATWPAAAAGKATFDDGDGFQTVRHGSGQPRLASGRRGSPGSAGTVAEAAPITFTSSNAWAALAGDDMEDMDAEDDDADDADEGADAEADAHEDGGHDDSAEADGGADEFELKQLWLAHCAACRALDKEAHRVPPCAIERARADRDEAEKRWKAAKTPHPLHKRVRWAQAELRDAEIKEAAHRAELDDHLLNAERRTKELRDRLTIDEARTQRKREALERLHEEGARRPQPAAARAAATAATGIATDIAPTLLAAIERLGTPLGEDADAMRRELQLVAVSLSRVEEVLREGVEGAPQRPDPAHPIHTGGGGAPKCFDIGDEPRGGARPGQAQQSSPTSDSAGLRPPTPPSRWTKAAAHGPWQRLPSSLEAAEEARRVVRKRAEASSALDPTGGGSEGTPTEGPGGGAAEQDQLPSGATTNDLAIAAKRDEQVAQQQFDQSQHLQHQQLDMQQQQLQESQRQQREQRRLEELERHQSELAKAAAARAADEAETRRKLIASLSPEELAAAAELQAQQAAIGSQVFGTAEAGQLAGLAHQAHVQKIAANANMDHDEAEVQLLMGMSPEQLAQWDRERQGTAVPW